jgi:hypothetical protein
MDAIDARTIADEKLRRGGLRATLDNAHHLIPTLGDDNLIPLKDVRGCVESSSDICIDWW